MTTVDRSVIEQALTEIEDTCTVTLKDNYSGRGMYGKKCFGVIGNQSGFLRFMIELAVIDPDTARDLADRVSTDGMGLSTIFYFPGRTIDGESISS